MSMLLPNFSDPPLLSLPGLPPSLHQGENEERQQNYAHLTCSLRRQNEATIVSSVISALQPTIAEAVAAALAATSTPASGSSSASGAGSSDFVPARDSAATPAKYNYVYKVANDGTQTYIQQEEQRDVSISNLLSPHFSQSHFYRAWKCRALTAMWTPLVRSSLSIIM